MAISRSFVATVFVRMMVPTRHGMVTNPRPPPLPPKIIHADREQLPLAAGQARLQQHVLEGVRAGDLAPYFEDAVHSLRELPHVIDVRNMGLVAGIELEPIPGKPTARAFEVFQRCYEKGVLVRTTGDIVALSPPLIISKPQIDEMVGTLGGVLREMGRQ